MNIPCFLSGHIYSNVTLICEDIPKKRAYRFSNVCSKCGKPFSVEIPYLDLFSIPEQELLSLTSHSLFGHPQPIPADSISFSEYPL